MEVDIPTTVSGVGLPIPVSIWCYLGKEGPKRIKADLDLEEITLTTLKEFVCRIVGPGLLSPHEIDILYNGGKLENDEAVKSVKFKPMNIITVIKLDRNPEPQVNIAATSSSVIGQIPQTALALRTAFSNHKFVPTLMKLGQLDLLDEIMEIAPGLKNDPVGVAVIQDAATVFQLSDFESLRKLANTRPWVIQAFNFLAGLMHPEKGARDVPLAFYNPAILADDDDMEEDDDEDELGAGPSSRITREQLSAALNSLNALGRMPTGSVAQSAPQPSATGSSLFDLFSQPGGPRGGAVAGGIPASTNPINSPIARLLSSLQQGGNPVAGSNIPALTPDLVARAMNTALSSLPAEVREARFSELRDQIARIQGMGPSNSGGNGSSAPTPSAIPPNAIMPPTTSSPLTSQPSTHPRYAQQLNQMRDMGIHDERLGVLALRVSDGDVGTAVELIFSGWTGEGADEEMPDEE